MESGLNDIQQPNPLRLRGVDRVAEIQEPHNDEIVAMLQKLPGCETSTTEDVLEWINNDEVGEFEDDEIVQMVHNADAAQEKPESDDEPDAKITHQEGYDAISTALEYISQQNEVTLADIICFRRWRDLAGKKHSTSKKQKNITDFFKRI